MIGNQEFDEFIINHPVFFEFYDVWNCGTVEEINEIALNMGYIQKRI